MSVKVAKTVFVGDTGVGKSCIAKRAFTPNFDPSQSPDPTIGAEFYEGTVKNESTGDSIKFEIWDTAGQEAFRALTPIFFKQSVIAIFVFDITKRKTIDALDYYVKILNEYEPNCFIAVVGNKIDLESQREISSEEGRQYAEKVGTGFYLETSALTGEGIDSLFTSLAHQNLNFTDIVTQGTVSLDEKNNKKRSCC